MEYRILIVDPDASWRRRYGEALIAQSPAPGVAYKIHTLSSPAAAQLQITRQRFHLVMVALDAAGAGIRLASTLKDLYRDDMRLLLLYDRQTNARQIQQARILGVRSVDRGHGGDVLVATVAEMLGMGQAASPLTTAPDDDPGRAAATLADVQLLLDMLRREARAQFAVYASNIGYIIAQHGDDTKIDVAPLASLIAGSFVNSAELGRLLHDPDTTHLSFHEGRIYDVYAANVGHDRTVALLFEKAIADPKLGYVFLMLKRAAHQLGRMRLVFDTPNTAIDQHLTESLNTEFDRIFGNELFEETIHEQP